MKRWLEDKGIQLLIAKTKLDYKSLKTGLVIGLGLLLVVWGGFTFYKGYSEKNTYKGVDSSNEVAMFKLDQAVQSSQNMTLVLYRHDCKYCKNVEKPLVRELQNLDKRDYLVIDIQTMDDSDIEKLSKIVPEILVDGNKIPTPLVANIKGDGEGKLDVLEKVDSDDMDQISKVIDKGANRL